MYNIYLEDQKRSKSELKARKEHLEGALESRRKQREPKLLESYKRRMENFATHVSDHPIVKKDPTNLVVKIRDEDPAKFLSHPCFKFTDNRGERQRVREVLEEKKNQVHQKYDFSRFIFRARDRSKEIQPGMRFQENGLEKIQNRLRDISPSDSFEIDFSEKNIKAMQRDPTLLKKFIAKHYRRDLNQKTHFKAITSFALNLPDVLQDKYEPKTGTNPQENNETEEDNPLGKRGSVVKFQDSLINQSGQLSDNSKLPLLRHGSEPRLRDGVKRKSVLAKLPNNLGFMTDPKTHTTLALINCNVIQRRNPNVNILRKGEGHFASEPEVTISELYQRFSHFTSRSDRITMGSKTARDSENMERSL